MKPVLVKLVLGVAFFGLVLSPTFVGMAESVSNRDVSVDQALGGGSLAGVLPPTAGQGSGSGVIGGILNPAAKAPFADPSFTEGRALPAIDPAEQTDKRAWIYDLEGTVRIAKKDVHGWQDAELGINIEEGHSLLTKEDSSVSITFDENYLNVTHIPANTKAIFRSLEPTDIQLEDGTVYNIFDALPKNSEWKVTTPTAVIAVRGTWWFVSLTTSNGDVITGTFDVPDDATESAVWVEEIFPNGNTSGSGVAVPEGNQMNLEQGKSPSADQIKKIDPKWLQQIKDFLERLARLRGRGSGGTLPPTSGAFFQPGLIDPAGSGVVGAGADSGLDPLDTGGVLDDLPLEEPFEESSSPEEEFEPDPGPTQSPGQEGGCDGEECYEFFRE